MIEDHAIFCELIQIRHLRPGLEIQSRKMHRIVLANQPDNIRSGGVAGADAPARGLLGPRAEIPTSLPQYEANHKGTYTTI